MSSGFITERELSEAREKRQEEWEKVRTSDQPLERPEEPYDPRPLYDRLKEQKLKKDMEYEEAHKLKNLVRGLDDDEVEFLDLVDRTKMRAEKQQQLEEEKELKAFREKVASLHEQSRENIIRSEISMTKNKLPTTATRTSQRTLLGSVLKKRKNGDLEDNSITNKILKGVPESSNSDTTAMLENNHSLETENNISSVATTLNKGSLKCIGILPGIGRYKESSDSEVSTDSDEESINDGKLYLFSTSCTKNKKKGDDSD